MKGKILRTLRETCARQAKPLSISLTYVQVLVNEKWRGNILIQGFLFRLSNFRSDSDFHGQQLSQFFASEVRELLASMET